MDSAPEGRTRVTRFVQFLRHLRSDSPLIVPDEENIAELAQNPRIRAEQDLRGHDAPTPEQFLQSVSRTAVFPTAEAGLKRLGWAEIPGSESRLGEGRRGTIMLAYKLSDRKVPLESRHLCAAKLQPRGDYTALSGEPLHEVMTEVSKQSIPARILYMYSYPLRSLPVSLLTSTKTFV